MNLWKFRRRKPGYDPQRPVSTGPEWEIRKAQHPISDKAEAESVARGMGDGWEVTEV